MFTDDADLKIFRKFHGRCVHCGRPAREIHEFEETRGAGGNGALREENRVTLCNPCHDWAHCIGIRVSGPLLKRDRDFALEAYA